MKIKITFKDPDALIDCISETVDEAEIGDLEGAELEEVRELRKQKYLELCGKWFEYSEYLTVEVDTEAETCVVVPVA